MKNLGLGCFSLKPLSFCRIWLIIFEYRGKAKHCRFWNPNKGKTLITPLILRCSPSSVLPLVPPNLPWATAMLWGSSYQSLCRSRSSWWGSDVLAIHAPCSLEDFLLWVCAFFFCLTDEEEDTNMYTNMYTNFLQLSVLFCSMCLCCLYMWLQPQS